MNEFSEEFPEEFASEPSEEELEGEVPEEMHEMISRLRKLDQDRVNDDQRSWLAMYGFPHECSCAADVESGNIREVPVCYLGAAAEAFDHLRRVRSFLYAIATSPSNNPEVFQTLAAEAFYGEPLA